MDSNTFKKYYRRISREGKIKSVSLGLLIGFSALALITVLSWFFGFKAGLWVGIGAFVLFSCAFSLIFYYMRFRPSTKEIAGRIDELGLEERVLTMIELENEDTYIAQRQREDTAKAMRKVSPLLVKIAVSVSLVIALVSCALLGFGMTAVESLYYAGVIDSGLDLIAANMQAPETEYKLRYDVGSGAGRVIDPFAEEPEEENAPLAQTEEENKMEQILKEGDMGAAVLAEAASGWVFVQWSDGYTLPYRSDKIENGRVGELEPNSKDEFIIYAIFEELEAPDIEEPEDPDLGQSGNGQGEGDGTDNGMPSMPQQGADGAPKPGGNSSGGGGRDDNRDQINDGKTFYGDEIDDARDETMGNLDSDESMSDEMKDWISDYYDSIGDGGAGSGNNDGNGSNGGD